MGQCRWSMRFRRALSSQCLCLASVFRFEILSHSETSFLTATNILTSATGRKAHPYILDGWDMSGKPIFRLGEDILQRTTISVKEFAQTTMAHIWARQDSRRIFYFLCLNLVRSFLEFPLVNDTVFRPSVLLSFYTASGRTRSDSCRTPFICSSIVFRLSWVLLRLLWPVGPLVDNLHTVMDALR